MFAQLGSVVFAVLGPLTDFDARREYVYAAHAPIEGKPRLQYIGDGLEEVGLRFALNEWFCDPLATLAELAAIGDRHEAVPLLWGDGRLEGRYVVTEIEHTVDATDPAGTPLRISGRLSLQEWAELPGGDGFAGADPAPAVATRSAAGMKNALPRGPVSTNPRATPAARITRKAGA